MVEIRSVLYGTHSRFSIVEGRDSDGNTSYMVRDADWILDSEVRAGRRPPIVRILESMEKATKWCDKVEDGVYPSIPRASEYHGWPELKQRVQGFRVRRRHT